MNHGQPRLAGKFENCRRWFCRLLYCRQIPSLNLTETTLFKEIALEVD
jgi:hypothetical protein